MQKAYHRPSPAPARRDGPAPHERPRRL